MSPMLARGPLGKEAPVEGPEESRAHLRPDFREDVGKIRA